jgi:hypothetical protein
MATETIILDFQVEQGDALAEMEKTKKSIIGLKEEQNALNKAYKEGSITVDEYAQESVRVEQVLKKETATYSTLTKAVTAQGNSINALTAQNKALKDERNDLDLTTKKGIERLNQINKQIDRNTDAITKNVSKLEQQKINIGNYASALDNVVPGFSQFTQGIQGSTTAAKALIATPLGALLAAIGVAVTAVTAYFSKFESVLDIVENTVTKATAVFDAFIQNLDKIGSIIGNVLIGNFAEAANTIGVLADELGNAADESIRLLEATRELEDAELKFRIESAAGANQMKAYVVAAKNKSLSIEESNALLQKASDLENKLTEDAVKIAQQRADIEEGKLVQSKKAQLQAANLLRQTGEAQVDYINRLIESGTFSPEQLNPLIAAYERVQQEASAGLAFQEKVANQQEALNAKLLEQKAKEKAALEEELRLKNQLAQVNERLAQQSEQESNEFLPAKVKGTISLGESIQKTIKEGEKQSAERKQNAQLDQLLTQQKLANASTVLNQVKGLIEEESAAYKVLAISQASIDTYRAASAALAPPPVGAGPLFGPILAATTIALGLANVAKIAGFSGGGYTGIGKVNEPAGIVHKGEVVFSQRDVSLMGGPQRVNAMRPTFKGYAEGGIVTAASTGPINQSFAFRSAMNNQPTIVASWKEATELSTRIQFKESLVTL